MKAINLIPVDERRGAGGAGGRSAGGAYVLLAALLAVVAMVASYTLTTKSANDRRSELAQIKADTAAAQTKAASLSNYTAFKAMRVQRVETVKSIAASRFDWAHAMHELARTLPHDVVLSGLRGTVTSGVPVTGGPTVSLRAALPSLPAIELAGCDSSQAAVAHMLVNLRRIDGVRRVSLQQSKFTGTRGKTDAAGAITGTGTSAAGGPIPANCNYQFQAVVFYDPVQAATPPATGDAQTAAATTATAPTTGATR